MYHKMYFDGILPFVNGDAQSVCAGEFEWPTGCQREESGVDILPPGAHSVIGDCPFLETKRIRHQTWLIIYQPEFQEQKNAL